MGALLSTAKTALDSYDYATITLMKRKYADVDLILSPLTHELRKIELLEKMVCDLAEYPNLIVNHSAINLKLRLEIQRQHELYSQLQEDYHKIAKQNRDMRELFNDAFAIVEKKSRKKL